MSAVDPAFDLGPMPAAEQCDRAMIAHDIRSALQGVIGGCLSIGTDGLDPAVRVQIERIAEAAKTLAGLVGAVLGDAPEPTATDTHSRVDLQRLLRHLDRRWTGEARERLVEFSIDAASDLPFGLRSDPGQLDRALGNLIGNAVMHSREGAVRLGIGRSAGGGIEFSVTNEGPGLAAEILERVLVTGARPTYGAARAGHGMGLHIVRSLCEQLGGEFLLGNRAAGGVEAILRFPAALCFEESPAGTAAAPTGTSQAPRGQPDLGGMRVLLAEDNPTNQMNAAHMLRALNAEVTITSDGVEAIAAFELAEFDLIVVDIEMPRMSGIDVIRAIRGRTDGRAEVPIVALTAYALREHRERISGEGANGLISKPVTSAEALRLALLSYVAPPPARTAGPTALAAGPDALIDRAVYEALCEAIGAETMGELLDKVAGDLLGARADLAAALDPLARASIRSASHILISVAGAIGATGLSACARTLNADALSGDAADLARETRRCLSEIDAAVRFTHSQRADS